MPFWRRDEETLNERLAREAGLSLSGQPAEPAEEPPSRSDDFLHLFKRVTQPLSDLAVIHGAHRAREWDAVVTAEAAGIAGDRVHFVGLEDGGLVVDEEVPEDALDRLADAVDTALEPPYRAEAVRRGGDMWAVGARKTTVVELPTWIEGEDIEVAVTNGERAIMIDGSPSPAWLTELEEHAPPDADSWVLRAVRLDERLWEIEVFPL